MVGNGSKDSRAVATALIVVALATAACGRDLPDPAKRPYPASARALLQKQAADLKTDISGLLVTGSDLATTTPVTAGSERTCSFEDPDAPPRFHTLEWRSQTKVAFTGRVNAVGHAAALLTRLQRGKWKLSWDFTVLIAEKNGQYLEIFLPTRTGGDKIVVAGHSRCVRSDGKVVPADPPPTVPFHCRSTDGVLVVWPSGQAAAHGCGDAQDLPTVTPTRPS